MSEGPNDPEGGCVLARAALAPVAAVPAVGIGILICSRTEIFRRAGGLVARFLVLCVGLCLSLSGAQIHGSPAVIVKLTPVAVRILLVNVAVSASIDVIVIGILGHEAAVAIGAGETGTSTSFGGSEGPCLAIGVGVCCASAQLLPLFTTVYPGPKGPGLYARTGNLQRGPVSIRDQTWISAASTNGRYRTPEVVSKLGIPAANSRVRGAGP